MEFICNFCNYETNNKSNLTKHIKICKVKTEEINQYKEIIKIQDEEIKRYKEKINDLTKENNYYKDILKDAQLTLKSESDSESE